MAQIQTDMTNAPPVGYRPAGANDRSVEAQHQIIAHELGHAVAVYHHNPVDGGDTICLMRYYFADMRAAAALGPPGDVPAFNAVPIGNTFCNTPPDSCRSDVDVSDQ